MTILRTHFLIDLTSAVAFTVVFVLLGEILSYFIDVLVLGQKKQSRELLIYNACAACGWSNSNPLHLIDNAEKVAQAHSSSKSKSKTASKM